MPKLIPSLPMLVMHTWLPCVDLHTTGPILPGTVKCWTTTKHFHPNSGLTYEGLEAAVESFNSIIVSLDSGATRKACGHPTSSGHDIRWWTSKNARVAMVTSWSHGWLMIVMLMVIMVDDHNWWSTMVNETGIICLSVDEMIMDDGQ